MKVKQLPITNESGYYEIRLESIGGLGANLCGKMMGELGLEYLGLNSASFSSYGSEKTGTPVKAFIRFCDWKKEIRIHSPVVRPHLLGIFHEALLGNPSVLEGCQQKTQIVINSEESGEVLTKKYGISVGKIYTVPAQQIAMKTHSRINVVMLGAMARVMGFVPLDAINEICKKALGKKYPDALVGNLEGIRRGYEEVAEYPQRDDKDEIHIRRIGTEVPQWGYETAPIGGINPLYGNSVASDVSPSRQGFIPVFIPERCINCGLCDSTCPDMVFQFQKGEYKGREMMINKGLDYYHCKGCLRCVEVCPVQALVHGVEAECPEKPWFLPNQEMLRRPENYEKTGADGYITSESYLTEKRMEGGEV